MYQFSILKKNGNIPINQIIKIKGKVKVTKHLTTYIVIIRISIDSWSPKKHKNFSIDKKRIIKMFKINMLC